MPEIIADGSPFEVPQSAANESYARATPPSIGSFVLSTLEDAGTAFLGRAAERGTQAGSGAFDQGMAALTAQGGAADQPLISVPAPVETPEIPADQANAAYGPKDADGKTVPITDKPIPEGLAKIIGQQKADAMQRESVLSRFAETHSGVTTFAAGALTSLLDPLNAGAMFVPGLGEGAIAARLGAGVVGRTVARLAAGAGTGIVQQAPLSALKMALAPEEASDYGVRDAMRDILYSAAGVAAFHAGIGTVGELLGRRAETAGVARETAPVDAATQNAAMQSAVGEIAEGRPVEVAPAIQAAAPAAQPETIGREEFIRPFTNALGETDLGAAANALTGRIKTALDAGQTVTLYADGKPVPIVAIDRGMMADAEGQRWGTIGIATAKDASNRVEIGPAPTAPSAIPEAVGRQVETQREGWAPGVSQDELAEANGAVYGPKAEAETPPPAPAAEGTAEPQDPEIAAAEQHLAGINPETLHPEDQAALEQSAKAVEQASAPTFRDALQKAAACIVGIV